MSPVVVSRHKCRARHRTGRSFARCAYPRAVVVGEGWVAVAVRCHLLRLELVASRAEAAQRLEVLAYTGCSAWCRGRHEMLVLQPASTTPRSLPTVPRVCSECGGAAHRAWGTRAVPPEPRSGLVTRRRPTSAGAAVGEALRDADRVRLLTTLEDAGPARVPCLAGDVLPAAWTSDEADELHLAAQACVTCPALAACRAYGLAWPDEAGVYGALTRAERLDIARTTEPTKEIPA